MKGGLQRRLFPFKKKQALRYMTLGFGTPPMPFVHFAFPTALVYQSAELYFRPADPRAHQNAIRA